MSVASNNMKNDLKSHANLILSMDDLRARLASQGKHLWFERYIDCTTRVIDDTSR